MMQSEVDGPCYGHNNPDGISGTNPQNGESICGPQTTEQQLRIIVEQQQKEIQSQKIRNQGITVINTCLQEERQENARLRMELNKRERENSVLQNRLSAAGLATDTSLQEGEALVPGASKQLLENLVRENTRLKQILRNYEQVRQNAPAEEKTPEMLPQTTRLDEKSTSAEQCTVIPQQMETSSELAHLEQMISVLQKVRDIPGSEHQCSVTEDSMESSHQIVSDMAEVCLKLAKKLQKSRQKQQETGSTGNAPKELRVPSTDSAYGSEEILHIKSENTVLRDEVSRLNAQCKELLVTNQRWQEYHEQREQQMRQEMSKVKVEASPTSMTSLSEHQQVQFDRLLQKSKQKAEQIEEEKVKIEDENRALRIQVQQLAHQIEQMSPHQMRQSQEDRDRISMLETQVQICTEDFESERRDRERAQQRILELEQELSIVKRQCEQFQTGNMQRLYNQRMAALSNYQRDYDQRCPGMPERQLVARGLVQYQADGPGDDDNNDEDDVGFDTIDSLPIANTSAAPEKNTSLEEPTSQINSSGDTLQCPRCKREYPSDRHNELLEHIDVCCA